MRTQITPFKVEAVMGADGAKIRVAGELDVETAPQLRECIAKATSHVPAAICLDLAELEFIDSTGLAVLVGAARELPAGSLRVLNLRDPVRRVFEVTGVDTVVALE